MNRAALMFGAILFLLSPIEALEIIYFKNNSDDAEIG